MSSAQRRADGAEDADGIAESSGARRLARRALQLGGVAVAVALAWALGRSGVFEWAVEGVASLGPWALPAFLLLHAISGVLFVPTAIPNIAGGLLFGVGPGLAVGLIGLGAGATLSFLIGRALGRDWLHRRFAGDARFHGLIRLVGQRGWKIIVLARLSPIFPFSVANYAFGLTPMHAWVYGLASIVGSIPSTLVFVSIGAAAGGIGEEARSTERTLGEWALLGIGLAAVVALIVVVRRLALDALAELRELERAAQEDGRGGTEGV
jgi:uncharacterized membrane protein YdjX (TVP38/TMEM64 family)